MSELKSCPFCGGEYTQVRYIGGEWQEPSAFVSGYRGECCSCYAITAAYDTEAEAAAAWNMRHVETCKDLGGTGANGEHVFNCSECGCVLSLYDRDGTNTLCTGFVFDYPRYCPSCGARVVDE